MSTTTKTTRKHMAIRVGLGLSAVAAVAGTLGGFGLHTAQAETSQPFGTANLLQSQDIGSLKANVGELNFQQTDLYGVSSVSACTGEDGLDSVTGDKDVVGLSSTWTNSDGQSDGLVTQAIAEARTPSQAKRDAQAVLNRLKSCQHEPKGHWRYGTVYHGPLRNHDDLWLDAIDGNGRVTGGVGIILQNRRFSVVEVSSALGDGDDAIKNTLYRAEQRLDG